LLKRTCQMNMQTIQIAILLLDSFIKLAPWRIVAETIDRIGCGADLVNLKKIAEK
jgi:hypothetical protein